MEHKLCTACQFNLKALERVVCSHDIMLEQDADAFLMCNCNKAAVQLVICILNGAGC